MSEYQYYEFLAVDRPLTKGEQAQVRALSTRAEITATRFVNEYHFGDFHGDTTKMVEQLYDAHLYFANWGSRRLLLRLPSALLAKKEVEPYVLEESLTVRTKGGYTLLDFSLNSEDAEEWDSGSFFSLSEFVGLRAELAVGDLRPLYLAWLAGLRVWELAEDDEEEYIHELEPQVPAGLGELTGAQRALTNFLQVDEDLLAVAVRTSAPMEQTSSAEQNEALEAFIAALPARDKDALLVDVVRGGGHLAGPRLLARFRAAHRPVDPAAARTRRSAAELLDAAHRHRTRRHEREQQAREAVEQARRRAAEKQRAAHLDAIAADPGEIWREIDSLIGQKKPTAYDRAATLLADLRAVTARSSEELADYERRTTALRETHRSKPALMRRFDEIGIPRP
ncbi:hypothetical protein [Streptomyces altiplanensis]